MRPETKFRLLMAFVAAAMASCPLVAVFKLERTWWAVGLAAINAVFWAFFLWLWWKATARPVVPGCCQRCGHDRDYHISAGCLIPAAGGYGYCPCFVSCDDIQPREGSLEGERRLSKALMMDTVYGAVEGRRKRIEELRREGRWRDG